MHRSVAIRVSGLGLLALSVFSSMPAGARAQALLGSDRTSPSPVLATRATGSTATPISTRASGSEATEAALKALAPHVARMSHPEALRKAFHAYHSYKAANPGAVRKPYLYFVDMGLNSNTARGYVFDMESLTLVEGPFNVAHGRGSAPGGAALPTKFSNRPGSLSTSLGLYLAQETYGFGGKSGGRSYNSVGLRLRGESGKFNSAARARAIVAHGAPYVTASRAGRSEGCPAMELQRARRLLPKISNGGMVFIFSPNDTQWLNQDPWVNAD